MRRNVICVCLTLMLCGAFNSTFSQQTESVEHPFQVGVVLEPLFPERVGSVVQGKGFQPTLPTAVIFKHRFHPKNAFVLYLGRGAPDGLSDYRRVKKDWFNGFTATAGYEHVFFAPRRFNLLTGLNLGYTYSREILYEFQQRSVTFPNLLKFHSQMGPGITLGMRCYVSNRFCLESNLSASYLYPMPYNTSFKAWRREGMLTTRRLFSLELHYKFGR